jgi:hypothetical protein
MRSRAALKVLSTTMGRPKTLKYTTSPILFVQTPQCDGNAAIGNDSTENASPFSEA